MVTAAPHAPLRVYVDAVQLTDLQDPLRHFPATYPIDVDFGLWPPEDVLVVAPKTRPLSGLWGAAAAEGWSGRLHMLAAYSRALSSEQVAANHAAWLVDSAPLTPDETVTATEDAPLRLDMAPRASTPFDATYSPRPPRPLTLHISSLPALGTLHADDGTGRAGTESAVSPRDLPLELPRSGFVWYRPPKDVHSAGAEASAALRYFASDGAQASLPGTLSIVLGGVNDPPEATPFAVEVYAGVPASFRLRATDVDSLVGSYTVFASPSHGTLQLGDQRLWAGSAIAADRNVTYTSYLEPTWEAAAAAAAGEALLQADDFRFRACDEEGACSSAAARVRISVLNSLRARGGSTHAREETPGVVQLDGADMRGGDGDGVGFRLLALPAHGNLFQCVPPPPPPPPPGDASDGGGWWSRRQLQWFSASPPPPAPPASIPPSPPCCVLPSCLRKPLEAGDAVGDAAGRLVYLAERDYFNCAEIEGHDGCAAAAAAAAAAADAGAGAESGEAGVAGALGSLGAVHVGAGSGRGAPDAFWFCATSGTARRSARARQLLWVRNVNDPPVLVMHSPSGAVLGEAPLTVASITAEVDAETPLPPMAVVDADGDLSPWQVDITAEHGYVRLNRTAAAPLRFALGGADGAHRLKFAATPSQLAAALAGATFRIDYLTNASLHFAVGDAAGARGAADLFVVGLPCNSSCTSSGLPSSGASLALWAAVVGVMLCCGMQLFGWLHRVCHPEELERKAQERYEVLEDIKLEAEERRELERQREQRGGRGDASPRKSWNGPEPEEAALQSIREWALKQRKDKTDTLQRVLAATRGRTSFERPSGSASAINSAIRLPSSACSSGARVTGAAVNGGGTAGTNGASMRISPGELDEHSAAGGALREPWAGPPGSAPGSPGSPRGSGPQMSAAVLAMVFGRRCSDKDKATHAQGQEPSRSSTVEEQVQRRCSTSSEEGDADARLSAGSPGASPSARPSFKPPALSRDGSRDSNHSFYSGPGPADLREAWHSDAVYGGDTPRGERASG